MNADTLQLSLCTVTVYHSHVFRVTFIAHCDVEWQLWFWLQLQLLSHCWSGDTECNDLLKIHSNYH